ncbi:MAG: hypothetical protein RBS99_04615 [Rhodospirillales bacterium]|nr:hypothetical protein [Rhodospirillales bacterium]
MQFFINLDLGMREMPSDADSLKPVYFPPRSFPLSLGLQRKEAPRETARGFYAPSPSRRHDQTKPNPETTPSRLSPVIDHGVEHGTSVRGQLIDILI